LIYTKNFPGGSSYSIQSSSHKLPFNISGHAFPFLHYDHNLHVIPRTWYWYTSPPKARPERQTVHKQTFKTGIHARITHSIDYANCETETRLSYFRWCSLGTYFNISGDMLQITECVLHLIDSYSSTYLAEVVYKSSNSLAYV
jgi:hypothetical protein